MTKAKSIAALVAFIAMEGCGGSGGGAAAGGIVTPPPTPEDPIQTLRIMPLGDSITRGSDPSVSYRKLIEPALGRLVTFQFVGSRSDNSAGMRYPSYEAHQGWCMTDFLGKNPKRVPSGIPPIDGWIKAANPDYIFFMLGVNEPKTSEDGYFALYDELLRRVYNNAPNVVFVWAKVMPTTRAGEADRRIPLNRAIERVAAKYTGLRKRVVIVDPGAKLNPATMTTDGIHPNEVGFQIVADAYLDGFKRIAGVGTSK